LDAVLCHQGGSGSAGRIVLLAADGVSNTDIAERVGGVLAHGDCLAGPLRDLGVKGLDDEQWPGRPRTVDRAKIIAIKLTPPP
jgi:hypothetical protein